MRTSSSSCFPPDSVRHVRPSVHPHTAHTYIPANARTACPRRLGGMEQFGTLVANMVVRQARVATEQVRGVLSRSPTCKLCVYAEMSEYANTHAQQSPPSVALLRCSQPDRPLQRRRQQLPTMHPPVSATQRELPAVVVLGHRVAISNPDNHHNKRTHRLKRDANHARGGRCFGCVQGCW